MVILRFVSDFKRFSLFTLFLFILGLMRGNFGRQEKAQIKRNRFLIFYQFFFQKKKTNRNCFSFHKRRGSEQLFKLNKRVDRGKNLKNPDGKKEEEGKRLRRVLVDD